MEDDLKFFDNGRQPLSMKMENDLIFLKMEDIYIFLENGRQPDFFFENAMLTNSNTGNLTNITTINTFA
jgi:hypothetical protein